MKIKFTKEVKEYIENMYSPIDRFKNWWFDYSPFKNIRRIYQRGTRGYADEDLWAPKYNLAKVIYNNLVAFKNIDRCGYPIVDEKDIKDKKGVWDIDKKAEDKWEKCLDDMIDGFKFFMDDNTLDYVEKYGDDWIKKYTKDYDEAKRKMHKFIDHLGSLWD